MFWLFGYDHLKESDCIFNQGVCVWCVYSCKKAKSGVIQENWIFFFFFFIKGSVSIKPNYKTELLRETNYIPNL